MFANNPIYSYIGMGLAAIAMVLGVILPEYSSIVWSIAGFLGFGSVAALRAAVDSKGWKTFASFGVIVIVLGLQLLGVITPEVAQQLMLIFAPITAITFQQALAKSPTSSIKKIAA